MAAYSHNHSFMQSFSRYYYGHAQEEEEEEVVKHGEGEEGHLALHHAPLRVPEFRSRFAWYEKPSTPKGLASYPTSSSSDTDDDDNCDDDENDDSVHKFEPCTLALSDHKHISKPPAPLPRRYCANGSAAGGGERRERGEEEEEEGCLPLLSLSSSPHVISAPPSPLRLALNNPRLEAVGDRLAWGQKSSTLKAPSYPASSDDSIDEFEFSRAFSDCRHVSMSPASLPHRCTNESIGGGGRRGEEGHLSRHNISSSPYVSPPSASPNCLAFRDLRHKVGDGFTPGEKLPSTPKAPAYPTSDGNDISDDGIDRFEFSHSFSDCKHISMAPAFAPRRCTNGSLGGGGGEGNLPRHSKSSSPYVSALSSPSYHAFDNFRLKVGDGFAWGEKSTSTPKVPSDDNDNGDDGVGEFEFSCALSDYKHVSMSPTPLPHRCTKDSLGGLYAKAEVDISVRPLGPLRPPPPPPPPLLPKASAANVPNDCRTRRLSSGFALPSSPRLHSLIKDVLLCGRDLYDIGGKSDPFQVNTEHLVKDGKGGRNHTQSTLSQCHKGSDLGSESFASCRSSEFPQEVMEHGEGIGEISPRIPFVKKPTTVKMNKKKRRPSSSKKWAIQELFSRAERASMAVTSTKGNSGQQILLQGDDDVTSSSDLSSCLVCASSSLTSSSSLSSSSSSIVSLASSARARESPSNSTLATIVKDRRRKSTQRHTSSIAASVSAHELLYTSQRLQSQAARKKTTLPYRGGLLGCPSYVPSTDAFRTMSMAKTM